MILRYLIKIESLNRNVYFLSFQKPEAGNWHCEMKQLTRFSIRLLKAPGKVIYFKPFIIFFLVLNGEVVICNVTIIFSTVERSE